MPVIPHVNISPGEDLESQRRAVEQGINALIDRINASGITQDTDMRQFRIRNLGYPASLRDAVNVQYLRRVIAQVVQQLALNTQVALSGSTGGTVSTDGIIETRD